MLHELRILGTQRNCARISNMKLVQAIIQPQRLDAVLAALERVAVERMTVLDGVGFGRRLEDSGGTPNAFAALRPRKLLRNVVLEIVVNDDFVERTMEAIASAARTGAEGRLGDGKIWVMAVDQTIQIGGNEVGPGAV
jgi:nitrogen regulatory protein PII